MVLILYILIALELNIFQEKKLISNKKIKTNVYKIQANVPITCGYFCIGFIDFMLRRKS